MKTRFFIVIFFILSHCGFTPIYSELENQNYKFNVIEVTGDNEMNNIAKLEMNKYSNINSETNVIIKIITNYQKNILSKNATGEATDFEFITEINFDVSYNNKNKSFSFRDQTKASNMEDQFALKKYEKTTKRNFINSKIKELILKLSTMQ